jgi:hypothetical protein
MAANQYRNCGTSAYMKILLNMGSNCVPFKSVAGHPCLFVRIANVEGKLAIVAMGIFVDDLFVGHWKLYYRNCSSSKESEKQIRLDR